MLVDHDVPMVEIPLVHAIAGGLLMGLGAGLLMLGIGRVGGIGGAYGSLVARDLGPGAWKALFIVGIVVGGVVAGQVFPGHLAVVEAGYDRSLGLVVASGLLMGFGGRMCNGCTSGHGVCGVARFSRRSIVATATFFAATLACVFLFRHVLGVL